MGGSDDGIENPEGKPAGGFGKGGTPGAVPLVVGPGPASPTRTVVVDVVVVVVAGPASIEPVAAASGAESTDSKDVGSGGKGIGSSFFEQATSAMKGIIERQVAVPFMECKRSMAGTGHVSTAAAE